jgi:hypothetical protein
MPDLHLDDVAAALVPGGGLLLLAAACNRQCGESGDEPAIRVLHGILLRWWKAPLMITRA